VRTQSRHVSSWEEAAQLAAQIQQRGGLAVFTNGVFDLLHPGHVRYLKDARALGQILIVGINSDRSVRENKGAGRPVNSELERAEVLLALSSVDAVIVFDELTPQDVIVRLRPDILVKGEDWPSDAIVGRDVVEMRGGRVVRMPLEQGLSTTELIRRVRGR